MKDFWKINIMSTLDQAEDFTIHPRVTFCFFLKFLLLSCLKMHAQVQTNLPQISNHLDELYTLLLVYALAKHEFHILLRELSEVTHFVSCLIIHKNNCTYGASSKVHLFARFK